MDGLNSNLDLNGGVPASMLPEVGRWGPSGVPSTRLKKRMRWVVVAALVLVTTVVVLFGWYMFTLMR